MKIIKSYIIYIDYVYVSCPHNVIISTLLLFRNRLYHESCLLKYENDLQPIVLDLHIQNKLLFVIFNYHLSAYKINIQLNFEYAFTYIVCILYICPQICTWYSNICIIEYLQTKIRAFIIIIPNSLLLFIPLDASNA